MTHTHIHSHTNTRTRIETKKKHTYTQTHTHTHTCFHTNTLTWPRILYLLFRRLFDIENTFNNVKFYVKTINKQYYAKGRIRFKNEK